MVIGITGHQRLEDKSAWNWVGDALRSILREISHPFTGVSSLAIGADQLFAELVLDLGGDLHVILPFPDYADTFNTSDHRDRYQAILASATNVEILPALQSYQESYLAAGHRVVDLSDQVLAVWNGKESAGLGGTGDIVAYARSTGRAGVHVDPVRKQIFRF
jgi:hypothetical protein